MSVSDSAILRSLRRRSRKNSDFTFSIPLLKTTEAYLPSRAIGGVRGVDAYAIMSSYAKPEEPASSSTEGRR